MDDSLDVVYFVLMSFGGISYSDVIKINPDTLKWMYDFIEG